MKRLKILTPITNDIDFLSKFGKLHNFLWYLKHKNEINTKFKIPSFNTPSHMIWTSGIIITLNDGYVLKSIKALLDTFSYEKVDILIKKES